MTDLSNVAKLNEEQRANLFEDLVAKHGTKEASRRWMAASAGSDASET